MRSRDTLASIASTIRCASSNASYVFSLFHTLYRFYSNLPRLALGFGTLHCSAAWVSGLVAVHISTRRGWWAVGGAVATRGAQRSVHLPLSFISLSPGRRNAREVPECNLLIAARVLHAASADEAAAADEAASAAMPGPRSLARFIAPRTAPLAFSPSKFEE